MTRQGLRLVLVLGLVLVFVSGTQAARRPGRDERLVELDLLRARVRVSSLGALAKATETGSGGEHPELAEYLAGEARARREALKVSRQAFATGRKGARARAKVKARRMALRYRERPREELRARYQAALKRTRHGEKKRLWRAAMQAGYAHYRVQEERAYQWAVAMIRANEPASESPGWVDEEEAGAGEASTPAEGAGSEAELSGDLEPLTGPFLPGASPEPFRALFGLPTE
jgi:hypothetical protein